MQTKTAESSSKWHSYTPDESQGLPGVTNTLVYMPKAEKAKMDSRVRKNRHGKAKYAVLYEVQKVIKVGNPEEAKEHGLDDSMELVDNRRFQSVNPRRRQKPVLPAMLAAADFRLRDNSRARRVSPGKTLPSRFLNEQQQLKDDHEDQFQKTYTPRINQRLRNKRMTMTQRGEKTETVIDGRISPHAIMTLKQKTSSISPFNRTSVPKNPQQEALARQNKILEKIKHVPMKVSLRVRKKIEAEQQNRQLFVLNDNSASRLGHHHKQLNHRTHCTKQRNNSSMSAHTKQPSALSNKQPFEMSQEQIGPSETTEELVLRTRRSWVPEPIGAVSLTIVAGPPKSFLEELMPRILVSETEGGCVNLTNEGRSEYATTDASAVLNYAHTAGSKRICSHSRRQRSSPHYDNHNNHEYESWSRQQLTSAGTQPIHDQYLLELMRPFASKAGVQGLGNKYPRVLPMSSQQPQRMYMKHGVSGGPPLSPLIGTRTNQRRPINTRCQKSKPMMIAAGLIYQSDEEVTLQNNPIPQSSYNNTSIISRGNPDLNSSLDTKRSPFRQQPSIDQESSGALNGVKVDLQPFCSQNVLPSGAETSVTPDFTKMLQSGTGTLATLQQKSSETISIPALSAKRKYSVFAPVTSTQESFVGEQSTTYAAVVEDELPYMTENYRNLCLKAKSQVEPRTMRDRVGLLPLKVKEQLQATQANQLFEFYEAVLQPSITPFTQLKEVASQTPKIGDKVSMLSSVRETLTKRYQLALAARTEAHRRLCVIEKLKALRSFIETRITFRPSKPGDTDIQSNLLGRVAYRETTLVDCNINELMTEIYKVGAKSQRLAAALQIQNWARMAVRRRIFKRAMRGLVACQRQWRYSRLRKFLREAKAMFKLQCVKLLQNQLRGYLAYQRYFAKLKGTMTRKNLDYIINRYADAKEFMLESLQIRLAYLTRKLIKKRAIEAELRRKAAIAEKKRIAEEKERERLRKIHEQRKKKKRQVKLMLAEAVEISYAKDDKRRDEVFAKEKKKLVQPPSSKNKIDKTKWDYPLEAVHYLFKQELFEGCYKNIRKRIATKKKGKNKDLNIGGTKNNSLVNSAITAKDRSVSPASTSPSRGQQAAGKNAAPMAQEAQVGPSLDPHHLLFYFDTRKFKVSKFDKHTDAKRRRKDTVTFEVGIDCLLKEQEKFCDPFFKIGTEKTVSPSERSSSTMVAGNKASRLLQGVSGVGKLPESPISINVPAPIGTSAEVALAGQQDLKSGTTQVQASRRIVNISQLSRQNSQDGRNGPVLSANDDLSAVDSIEQASNSSDELSTNSETYDFLMVYMPQIRPVKVVEPEEIVEEIKKSPLKRGKTTAAGSKSIGLKRQKTIAIAEESNEKKTSVAALANLKSPLEAITPPAQIESRVPLMQYAEPPAEKVILPLKVNEMNNDNLSSPAKTLMNTLTKQASSSQAVTNALLTNDELFVISEVGTKAGKHKECEMKIEVQNGGGITSNQSENVDNLTLIPPQLEEKSQYSQKSFGEVRGDLGTEDSRKVLRSHILSVERQLVDDSESVEVSHARRILIASGEGTVKSNENIRETLNTSVTKCRPKLLELDPNQPTDAAEQDGGIFVDAPGGSKSTATLMTRLGAYYHTNSTTIFQHDEDQQAIHVSQTASSAVSAIKSVEGSQAS